MGQYTEPLKKEDVLQEVSSFLEKQNPNPGDGWTPVTNEDHAALVNVIYNIIACKWERDCDGSLPINFEVCDRNTRHFLPFCTLPYDNTDPKRTRIGALVDIQEYIAGELSRNIRLSLRELTERKDL